MNYSDFQFLQFDHKPNGILLITINRPEVMNATNARLHWELTKVWGVVNFGLVFALIQFSVAGGVAFYYSRRAGSEFDRRAREIAKEKKKGKVTA